MPQYSNCLLITLVFPLTLYQMLTKTECTDFPLIVLTYVFEYFPREKSKMRAIVTRQIPVVTCMEAQQKLRRSSTLFTFQKELKDLKCARANGIRKWQRNSISSEHLSFKFKFQVTMSRSKMFQKVFKKKLGWPTPVTHARATVQKTGKPMTGRHTSCPYSVS